MHHNLESSICDPLKYKMGDSILYLFYQHARLVVTCDFSHVEHQLRLMLLVHMAWALGIHW